MIEKAPEITACDAMMVAAMARMTSGSAAHCGAIRISGLSSVSGVAQQHRALPEVVEHQRGPDQQVPRDADRSASEMTHVGIKRLGAGDGQHHGAQRQQPLPPSLMKNMAA